MRIFILLSLLFATSLAQTDSLPELVHTQDAAKLYDDQSSNWVRTSPSSLSDFTARSRVIELLGDLTGKTIIDLGCGEGYVSRLMMQKGAKKIYGLDLSAEMIARAKEQDEIDEYGIEYSVVDARDVASAMAGIQADIIISVFLFNYMTVADMETVMSGVHRLLKPGGRYIYTVPHPLLPFIRRDKKEIFWYEAPEGSYLESRDEFLSGRIEKADGTGLHVQSHHKTFQDYFQILRNVNFGENVRLFEYGVTEDLMQKFPENRDWLSRIQGIPLHAAFECHKSIEMVQLPPQALTEIIIKNDSTSALKAKKWRTWDHNIESSDLELDISPAIEEFHIHNLSKVTSAAAFSAKEFGFLEVIPHYVKMARSLLLKRGAVLCTGMTKKLVPNKEDMKLFYAVFAAFLSDDKFLDKRGRLYDVSHVINRQIRGGKAGEDILLSSTNETCGWHSDSTANEFNPPLVGLLSLQKSRTGGGELQLVNSQNAYVRLQYVLRDEPELMHALHRPVVRDIILNGTKGGAKAKAKDLIRENAFPIFSFGEQNEPHCRYMRYWIETGHSRSATHLDQNLKTAMDVFDTILSSDKMVPRLKRTLENGEFIFIDNRILLHRRTAFSDNARHQVRVWMDL